MVIPIKSAASCQEPHHSMRFGFDSQKYRALRFALRRPACLWQVYVKMVVTWSFSGHGSVLNRAKKSPWRGLHLDTSYLYLYWLTIQDYNKLESNLRSRNNLLTWWANHVYTTPEDIPAIHGLGTRYFNSLKSNSRWEQLRLREASAGDADGGGGVVLRSWISCAKEKGTSIRVNDWLKVLK